MKGARIIGLTIWLSLVAEITSALDYMPRYQPELDQLSIENYIRNERLFNLHINCLLFDGPCDSVGRWMKPRMASYLLGSCIICTPNQEKEAEKFMSWLYEYHPQLFRMGITKYLDANGITLPEDSKFKELAQQNNVPTVESEETGSVSSGGLRGPPSQIAQAPLHHLENQNQQQLQQAQPEQPGIHNQHLLQPQSFQQNNQPHHPEGQQEQLNEQKNQQQQQPPFGNQRILNPNSRKHKFSAGMNTFITSSSSSYKARPVSIEDDEAENEMMEVTTGF